MKTFTGRNSFAQILHRLAVQNPEEKLQIAFRLNLFVKRLREAGDKYGKTIQRHRTRATA